MNSMVIDEALLVRYGMTASSRVLVKINLSEAGSEVKPKTDPFLLHQLVDAVICMTGGITVCECAQGNLEKYLRQLSFSPQIDQGVLHVIDPDTLPDSALMDASSDFGTFRLPRCLSEYDFRIAFAAASQRPNCIYSNCVKLFVGIVPYRTLQMYPKEIPGWRPRLHMDLHNQVCGIFQAVEKIALFHLFLSGGNAFREGTGAFSIPLFHSIDASSLDMEILRQEFHLPTPLYLQLLTKTHAASGNRSALLLIDVQQDYCSPMGYYAHKDSGDLPITRIADRLVRYAADHPCDYVLRSAMCYRRKSYADEPCLEGTWGMTFYGDVPSDFDFVKYEYSCFSSSEFCDYLRRNKIGRLVLTGFQTTFCVYATAVAALRLGFSVEIPREYVGDRAKHAGRAIAALKCLAEMGCSIT